jgi:hypothetical protein
MRTARLWTGLCVVGSGAVISCSDGSVTAPGQVNVTQPDPGDPSPRAIVHKDLLLGTALGGGPLNTLAITVAIGSPVCPPSPASPAEGVLVEAPSGKTPSHAVTRTAFVQVFEFPAVFTDLCQLVGAPLVATGNVFFSHTATQFFGPGSGPGSFVLQIRVHGIVDLVEGGQARLQAFGRLVIRPDGTLVRTEDSVKLTPI